MTPPSTSQILGAARQVQGPLPDRFVGRYLVLSELGSGGMATVYRAWDPTLQREVALKVVPVGAPEEAARFRREATIAASLNHPNIVPIYEVGEFQGRGYLAMALVDGPSLAEMKVDRDRATALVAQAARAVHAAHERGILHRDIKPGNLVVDSSGRLFVADFGLARRVGDPSLSVPGMILGTPAFMSPEQARGDPDLDVRTDVYSLGATLRAMIDETDLLAEVRTIVGKSTAQDREDRYATALELAEDLERYLRGEPIRARPSPWLRRLGKRIRRNPAAWALGGLLVVALLAAVPIFRSQRRDIVELEAFRNSARLPRQVEELDLQIGELLRAVGTREQITDDDARRILERSEEALARLDAPARRTSVPDAFRGWVLVNLGRVAEGEELLRRAAGTGGVERGDPYGTLFLARWRARKICLASKPTEADWTEIRSDLTPWVEWPGWSEAPENAPYRTLTAGLYRAACRDLAGAAEELSSILSHPTLGRDARMLAALSMNP